LAQGLPLPARSGNIMGSPPEGTQIIKSADRVESVSRSLRRPHAASHGRLLCFAPCKLRSSPPRAPWLSGPLESRDRFQVPRPCIRPPSAAPKRPWRPMQPAATASIVVHRPLESGTVFPRHAPHRQHSPFAVIRSRSLEVDLRASIAPRRWKPRGGPPGGTRRILFEAFGRSAGRRRALATHARVDPVRA
jgi:hypothetical protein